ncbi:hypothetical protein B0A50_02690 [Salinomyces thailandicus]|uniref:Uncharacterized protein n=1 Tax=Salinomyces thailandicus TaxID=706561 RepID=A0A4U0U769_9PEZI|nr:hypothetical protein B0A50_02690 [Salinomyces thailandica]
MTNGRSLGARTSASNSSGTSDGISLARTEQKRRTQDITPPASHAGTRRSTLGAGPDPGPFEQVATRWNPNGVEPAFEQASFDRSSRRSSYVPAFSNSPRAVSPEQRRGYSPASTIRNGHMTPQSYRSGARSPVSIIRNGEGTRAESPLRGELTSPNDLVSPMTVQGVPYGQTRSASTTAPNGNAFTNQQEAQQAAHLHQATLAALQGDNSQEGAPPTAPQPSSMKSRPISLKGHRISLQTQIPPPPPVPEEEEEEEEEMDEVITMSPAARKPILSFRKSRSSLALSAFSAVPSANNSQVNLSGTNLTADQHKPYFGQAIDSRDLLASGIENAFSRL